MDEALHTGLPTPEDIASYGEWSMGIFVADSAVMFFTQLLFFGMGWVFFMRKLFKDYEVCCMQDVANVPMTDCLEEWVNALLNVSGAYEAIASLLGKFGMRKRFIAFRRCAKFPCSCCSPQYLPCRAPCSS
jgi:hypothetical protein